MVQTEKSQPNRQWFLMKTLSMILIQTRSRSGEISKGNIKYDTTITSNIVNYKY